MGVELQAAVLQLRRVVGVGPQLALYMTTAGLFGEFVRA
jgi:hypothetical protein